MKRCEHDFESEDGPCRKCKKTVIELWLESRNETVESEYQDIGYWGQFVEEIELK